MENTLGRDAKVAIVNFSGNVAKSTLAAHMLAPRIGGEASAKIFGVESVNVASDQEGVEIDKRRGRAFGEMIQDLMLHRGAAVVDVGASNAEEFFRLMTQFVDSHEEFNAFVVPITSDKKVMADSVNTILVLNKLGVPSHKIRVVFSRVDVDDAGAIEKVFAPIFGLHSASPVFTLNKEAVVYNNDVFEKLKMIGRSLQSVLSDRTDYRALLQAEEDAGRRAEIANMILIQRLALSASKNLDDAFRALFG